MMNNRRVFLKQTPPLIGLLMSLPAIGQISISAKKTILLRSSWQTVNIGDIGHTPGALRLLERYLPDVQLILWPTKIDNGVDILLARHFPRVRIAEGQLDANGQPDTPALQDAFRQADLFIHGSGSGIVASAHTEAWHKLTGKPYGFYGVSIVGETLSQNLRDLLTGAAFYFARDTSSLSFLKQIGVSVPVMAFAPDATFGIDWRDDQKGTAYLKSVGLEPGKFICTIPRLRWTPYFQILGKPPTEREQQRYQESQQYKETDHAKLREVIIQWVRHTGHKVLACPEMTYEIPVAKELLIDPLPADVKPNVVWRDTYWTPDEASSVYAAARAVISFEMHSPILAVVVGTPAIYLRQPTDTRKGQMWRDIGLNDWIFEIDNTTGDQIARQVLTIDQKNVAAKASVRKAIAFARKRQQASMRVVEETLLKSQK